ncbi:histidine phosphatase family protein [Clostridium paraputrificum]|uniref:histidine phosphatase family protein n=1 Tax=Clostridium paraputrificum TaxID=29363 RepID=UPI003D34A7C1
MKIGMVRHFKIDYTHKRLMDSNEFQEYITNYDKAGVIENKIDISYDKWDRCYCSDLSRTIKTAESIYSEEIETTKLLREVTMYPVVKSKFRIPSFIWSITSRIGWKINHKSQLEGINDTRKRAEEFINKLDINKSENILIVSHGFFMITLVKELKKLGFNGDVPMNIKNGYLYILEN